jgi:1-acyl-sn-glycerol-3-phosphate acyltransferase
MLYRILHFLFRLTVKGYFRSIYIKGKEVVPATGPVIFAPNHPSAFMDPILLATEVNRQIYFLARGDIFKKKWLAAMFRVLHMIPVFRQSEGDTSKNSEVFRHCFHHLNKGGTLMIFPEGVSKTERNLRPIKTGTARIALGAEAENDFNLGVTIIPIGINYSDPHHFQGDVFVNFGKPISVAEYAEEYQKNPWQTVEALTARLQSELEKLVVIVEDEQLERLISNIERLYRSKLRQTEDPQEKAPADFYLSKDIVRAVEYHLQKDPKRLLDFETRLDTYLASLNRLGIRDTQVRASRLPVNFAGSIALFVLGFPLFLYGFIFNYIPYRLPGEVVRRIPMADDFVGSVQLAGGMLIFLITYIVQGLLVYHFIGGWWALAFVISLYPAGVFAVAYLTKYYRFRGTLKYLHLFIRKSDLIAHLKNTRANLVKELETGKDEYLAATKTA